MDAAASREGHCEARARRKALAAAVHAAPESPEAWWALLSGEEAAGAALTGACPALHVPVPPEAAGGLVSAAERGTGCERFPPAGAGALPCAPDCQRPWALCPKVWSCQQRGTNQSTRHCGRQLGRAFGAVKGAMLTHGAPGN